MTESLSTYDEDPKRRPPGPEAASRLDETMDLGTTANSDPENAFAPVQSDAGDFLPSAEIDALSDDVSLLESMDLSSELHPSSMEDMVAADAAHPFDPPTCAAVEDESDHGFDVSDFETNLNPTLQLCGIPERIGDYVIERMIGSGGMGRVYLAKHQTMQRVVAIKTLPPDQSAMPWAVDRFYEEVRATARLLHPNIATAFDAGHSSGIHFLAMEYVRGVTLTALVAEKGPLGVGEAINAIRGAARGLSHAHAAGVIHRDVKPSNLMRADDGTIKVVDLGLAFFAAPQQVMQSRRDDTKRGSGRLLGTIAFMSPEQLENPDNVDLRTDIYSLGATLYFLLTGRPPYEGEFLEQVRAIRNDPVPELFSSRPDVDLRLEHVFRRMMAKRPQERYASLVEVLADLATYDSNESAPAWMHALSAPNFVSDPSTHRGGSTSGEMARVMGIDFGMFYATCAVAEPSGTVQILSSPEDSKTQHRLAIADGEPLLFGDAAASRREQQPGSVLHCLPLYVGQSRVDHLINGRKCPAEVLLAMQLRKLVDLYWPERMLPQAVAITVPSSYDQFHRQAILQAATIAGIRSVRLVDRSLAVAQSWQHDEANRAHERTAEEQIDALKFAERPQVIVSITGMATEVVVCRHRGSRVQQLAAVGQWHYGTLQWQQKLVDMVAEACIKKYHFDPRHLLHTATALQVACERAMPKFLLLESVNIVIPRSGRPIAISISRSDWLEACEPLANELLHMIDTALENADIDPSRVGHCFLVGILTRVGQTRSRITAKFGEDAEVQLMERTDIARGAAICVAGELPGRGDIPLPPQASTTHDLGLLVIDNKNRRRIRPIIPRGTAIPARTNRRIATGSATVQNLTVVESSTWRETAWRSLGNHRILMDDADTFLDVIFEVNVDGRLVIRRRDPNTGASVPLHTLPQPTLTTEQVQEWAEWIREWMPLSKRR